MWRKEVEDYALGINAQFPTPLVYSEVKATAKSIAKYCWKHDAEVQGKFSQKQAERGKLGGLAKGAANEQKRVQARLLAAQGMSKAAIARELNVHRNSITNWLS